MMFVSDEVASSLITHELAFAAVTSAFRDLGEGAAVTHPVVIGSGCEQGQSFTVKSGTAVTRRIVGLKVGSYWPRNDVLGLPRHNSSILLLDPDTGRPHALVAAARLNGFRTAAADAVAVDALARTDAATLAVIGAGHQACFEVAAIRRVRSIEKILIVSRDRKRATEWASKLQSDGVIAQVTDAETACQAADIVVTVTTSTAPLFTAEWIRPGTHISSMGSDQVGKQELPPALLERASLFADLPEQATKIGEFQHVAALIASGRQRLTGIGDVIRGVHPGRRHRDEVTIFDSSGIALQDLYVAAEVATRALASGQAVSVRDV